MCLNLYMKMVLRCFVCGINRYDHSNLTFHSIPSNESERGIWFSLLGFLTNNMQRMPKRPRICSNHFEKADFHYKRNGKKFLNKGAYPKACETFQDDWSNISRPASAEGTIEHKGQLLEDNESSSITDPASSTQVESTRSSISESLGSVKKAKARQASHLPHKQGNLALEKKKKKRKVIMYVGNLSVDDFDSPIKRQRNLDLVKRAILEQRTKIDDLYKTIGTLNGKIINLKHRLKRI
ncbi:uncharacterized protein LOC132707664 [Cylas formicarius]|uniref:uncharacterized protein LOC132707664 n=1 Tax=Cylas formicarius TaxID=197179 RepID=UPI002958D961|nr:uncharacterized protein LOC132707664 [Cylas formicarius]XP_060535570.1 uncharacterized protein LOC132707664 [Cylas formicarius]XP_060535571.1 uncharacterized protein LOC132707664 [Cylas formicarius]